MDWSDWWTEKNFYSTDKMDNKLEKWTLRSAKQRPQENANGTEKRRNKFIIYYSHCEDAEMSSSQLKPERNMELHKNKQENTNHPCIILMYPQITNTLNAISNIFILPKEKWSSYGNTGWNIKTGISSWNLKHSDQNNQIRMFAIQKH